MKINSLRGILIPVLKLPHVSTFDDRGRVCVLSFDETDMVLKPSQYIQVVMIRGLYRNWKQIICYNSDSAMTEMAVRQIIVAFTNINFIVVAMVCDLVQPIWDYREA